MATVITRRNFLQIRSIEILLVIHDLLKRIQYLYRHTQPLADRSYQHVRLCSAATEIDLTDFPFAGGGVIEIERPAHLQRQRLVQARNYILQSPLIVVFSGNL